MLTNLLGCWLHYKFRANLHILVGYKKLPDICRETSEEDVDMGMYWKVYNNIFVPDLN